MVTCYLFIIVSFANLSCHNAEQKTNFHPPPLDQDRSILIAYDDESDNLGLYVPAQYVQPIKELAKFVSETRETGANLCSRGPTNDSLFRYYQRKFFHEYVFSRCYGQWDDEQLIRNLQIYDSLLPSVSEDSAEVFKDSSFIMGYSEYLSSIELISEKWESILATNSNISSIHFQSNGNSIFSVYSHDRLSALDFNKPYVFMDKFIMQYGSQVIPADYENSIRSNFSVFFRYFENTIQVIFPVVYSNPDCYYDVTMILDQPCIVE
jgi:hypothetical protein